MILKLYKYPTAVRDARAPEGEGRLSQFMSFQFPLAEIEMFQVLRNNSIKD